MEVVWYHGGVSLEKRTWGEITTVYVDCIPADAPTDVSGNLVVRYFQQLKVSGTRSCNNLWKMQKQVATLVHNVLHVLMQEPNAEPTRLLDLIAALGTGVEPSKEDISSLFPTYEVDDEEHAPLEPVVEARVDEDKQCAHNHGVYDSMNFEEFTYPAYVRRWPDLRCKAPWCLQAITTCTQTNPFRACRSFSNHNIPSCKVDGIICHKCWPELVKETSSDSAGIAGRRTKRVRK